MPRTRPTRWVCVAAMLLASSSEVIGQDGGAQDAKAKRKSTLEAVSALANGGGPASDRRSLDAVRALAAERDDDEQPQRNPRAQRAKHDGDRRQPAGQPRQVGEARGARQAGRQDRVPGGWAPDPTIGFVPDRRRLYSPYFGGAFSYYPSYYYPGYSMYYYPVRYYGYDHFHPGWYGYQPPVATISAPVTIMYDDPLGRQQRTMDETIRRAAEDPPGRPR